MQLYSIFCNQSFKSLLLFLISSISSNNQLDIISFPNLNSFGTAEYTTLTTLEMFAILLQQPLTNNALF